MKRLDLYDEIAALRRLTVLELVARYLEVFGEETRSRNKVFLYKRIAYRLQEIKHGGLTAEAAAKAEELAPAAPLRRRLSPEVSKKLLDPRDPRLPPVGTELTRRIKGVEHKVIVHESDFEYGGKRYPSLSVVARVISGTKWNGYAFFGLTGRVSA